jgi:hypothetical protein
MRNNLELLDMVNRNDLAAYTSSLVDMTEHAELQERLRLYQVFLKLYEHHRELLNEILDLENSSRTTGLALPYIQGFMSSQQPYLVTNLMRGKTQALMQPQQIWLIGRDSRQSLIAIQDIRLSRCHAAIRYVTDQGFYLTDLGSRNQSFVNGEPVRNVLLKDGDQIRLGSVAFSFFLCKSTQTLKALSSGMIERVNHWQSLASIDQPDQLSQPDSCLSTDDSVPPTLELYNDTSGFLRANQGSNHDGQPLF